MLNFTREAENLMAATTPSVEGGIGIRPSEWRDLYGDLPHLIEKRDLIARWLQSFTTRAIREIEEERAQKTLDNILKDLERKIT